MQPAISVENLGKRYVVNHEQQRGGYRTMRESLTGLVQAPLRRLRGEQSTTKEAFWALNDVSFDVNPGEVVGIIGRNGAGKSTLLKVLSRITKPTSGQVRINGRVGSLLEVGTGFHPELTGRENVFLNGSILGMSRQQIKAKFDEIVAFAEVERFLDTPVKRYSSGMYVRLAFAIAAYLEPEVLLIDEVLAVGDAVFQRRCVDRMAELAKSGRALLFVSHQLDIVKRFCDRGVLLENGSITTMGPIEPVLEAYRASYEGSVGSSNDLADRRHKGHGKAVFTSVKFMAGNSEPANIIASGEDLRCVLEVDSSYNCKDLSLAVVLKTLEGARIVTSWSEEAGFVPSLSLGRNVFECKFREVRLRPGQKLLVDIWMYDGHVVDEIDDVCMLEVIEGSLKGFSSRTDQGPMLCNYDWSCAS